MVATLIRIIATLFGIAVDDRSVRALERPFGIPVAVTNRNDPYGDVHHRSLDGLCKSMLPTSPVIPSSNTSVVPWISSIAVGDTEHADGDQHRMAGRDPVDVPGGPLPGPTEAPTTRP
jgi:hypothetical protein